MMRHRPGKDPPVQGVLFHGQVILEILTDHHIFVRQPGGAFQQARMEVEDVARVGFTTGRAAQEQRDLAVGPGVLGKIIINDQGIAAGLHELLTHGAAGIGGDILHGCGLISSRQDHDGVSHGTMAFQQSDGAGHRSFLLPDGDINADQVLPLLIDDGVYGDGRLAGLAIANDELALPATDRDHGINGLDAGLDGGIHILALHHTGCNAFDRTITGSLNGTLGIHRLPQGVDHASDQTIAHRDRSDAPGGPGGHALDNPGIITHDDDTDGFLLQVEGNPHDAIGELNQFL